MDRPRERAFSCLAIDHQQNLRLVLMPDGVRGVGATPLEGGSELVV
jgi:hypothetical protein